MEFPKDSNLNEDTNIDLQNELLELAELYPDSEEEDILQDENDLDDEGLFENDYEAIEQGFQPNVPLQDALLKSLKAKYGDSIFYNTDEENDVILHCADSDLQALLIKNRVRAKQLRVLRNKLVKVLQDCVEKVQSNTNTKSNKVHLTMPKLDTWKLGIPYFKDGQFYRCPENSDETRKRNNKELCLFDFRVGRRWTLADQVILRGCIESSYYKNRLNEVQLKINHVKIDIRRGGKSDEDVTELSELEEELTDMKEDPSKYRIPPRWCNVGIDWNAVSDSFKGFRTVNECKAMWNVYLHPEINKNLWTDDENKKIKALVKKHNGQNWDLIAMQLNTNRSGYLVFLNYFSNLWHKFKNERFQPSEDEHLMKVVEKCRIGNFIPWRKVSLFFQDRSKQQLYHRYKYYLSQGDVIKGTFTEAEDILIVYLIGKLGKDYSKCAGYVPTRTSIQIRNRYTSYLDKLFINLGQYSEAEDQKILDHVKVYGTKSWTSLAVGLKRGRSHVRQRYLTLHKWLQKSGNSMKNIPSRKLDVLSKQTGERHRRLQEVIKRLNEYTGEVNLDVVKAFLKKQEELNSRRKPWRVLKKKASPSFVDSQLVDFFKGTCKIQREYKGYGEQSIKDSAARVGKLLDLLGAPTDLLLHHAEADEANFSEREREVVKVSQDNDVKPTIATFLTPQIRFLLPPTLNTVLGLRGLIVKYQMHKNSAYRNDSAVALRIEQNLKQHDESTRLNVERERRTFFERFYALFKWASIVSKFFPEQLEKSDVIESVEIEPPKKPRGRPQKTENPKIALMLNGRKRKRFDCDKLNTANVPVVIPPVRSTSRKNKKKEAYPLTYCPTTKAVCENATKTSEEEDVPITGVHMVTADVLERIKQNNKVVILHNPVQGVSSFKIVKIARVSRIQSLEHVKLVPEVASVDSVDET